jgi:alpha-L-fucosidase
MTGEWFDEARFGMFIHWDHASQRGWEISWPMVGGVFTLPYGQDVGADEYHALAATFDPQAWDPVGLAALARAAGMRYAVLTTRHHNGYAMWPSAVGGHASSRDFVREFVDAFRAEGLRIGFYYSLSDWHHPDYPAWTDADRPYRVGTSPPRPTDSQAERFRTYLRDQLRELLTGYGDISVLWFDGGWERPSAWWDADAIEALARELQPGILLNDRLSGKGDFRTPEQFVPPTSPGGRWESCMTMNESWGWNPLDTHYKSPTALVHTLVETVGRGGNLLLNVSPRGDGSLPPEQVDRLEALATWMGRHAEAVHGTVPGLEPWQHYGPSTRRGDRLFLFLLGRPYETVTVRGVHVRRVRRAVALGAGVELAFTTRTGIIEGLAPDPEGEVTIEVPADVLDPFATVIALDMG